MQGKYPRGADLLPIDKISINPENRNIFSSEEDLKFHQLKKYIAEKGLKKPIIVNSKHEIVAGHRRFEAVLQLGWDKIWIQKIHFKSRDDEIEFLIKDNILNRDLSIGEIYRAGKRLENIYNINKIKGRAREFISGELGISPASYARVKEIYLHGSKKLLNKLESGDLSIRSAHRQVKDAKIKKSIDRKLDKIRERDKGSCLGVIFGDPIQNMQNMKEGSVQLVITDPPISYSYEWVTEARRVLSATGSLFVFRYKIDSPELEILSRIFTKEAEMVWTFRTPIRVGRVHQNHSYLLWYSNGAPRIVSPITYSHFDMERPKSQDQYVDKPVGILKHFINCTTYPGDLVLDPFAGFGSTISTATAMNRRAIGIEFDKKLYVESYNRLDKQKSETTTGSS